MTPQPLTPPQEPEARQACLDLTSNRLVREYILDGPNSLMGSWKAAIVKELTDPDSLFDRHELAVVHATLEAVLERIQEGAALPEERPAEQVVQSHQIIDEEEE